MNILVTGGAGYIGSHMVKELLARRYRTGTLDDMRKGHRVVVASVAFVEGDCSDASASRCFTVLV